MTAIARNSKRIRLFATSCALAGTLVSVPAGAATLEYDIVVCGGSFSAAAAAFAAARTNQDAQVLLIEPTDWLGGQATSQGVSAIDNSYHAPANTLMRDNEPAYYAADYLDWLDRIKTKPPQAPGTGYDGPSGWVSRHCYDPRTGAWALDEMAAEFDNLTVMKLTVVKNVATTPVVDAHGSARRIDSLSLIERAPQAGYDPFDDFLSAELPDWYSATDSSRFAKETHTVVPRDGAKGLVVIEASELGDAMVLSGSKFTQGREVSTEKIAEDGTLPAYNDAQSMAMVYPFCFTTSTTTATENELKAPWADFDTFLAGRAASYFSLSGTPWVQVFTYRRLLANGSNGSSSVAAGDVTMQNWNPGNDYRQGNWLLSKAATLAQAADWQGAANLTSLAIAEEQAVAWYFWLKPQRSSFPTADTRFLSGDDPLNMMGTEHGLAKFPYIRCMRRIVGLDNFRVTGRYWRNTQAAGYANGTSFRYYDSVGIGNYSSDVRPLLSSTGIAPPFSLPAPFYIPYRALASHDVRNMLACGKAMAQTYVTNSGYRLHPIEWASGSAAGTAAALMFRDGATNHDLLEIPALRELQAEVALNQPIRWVYTGEPVIPPQDGDLVVYDFQPLPRSTAYQVEAYHPTATRAEIYVNGGLVGQTTTRSNGRLLYNGTDVLSAVSPALFEAKCYDAGNALLATLSASVEITAPVLPCELEPGVTDNDDDDGYFTTVGSWGSGTAQADRWCPSKPGASYTLTNSNDGNRYARWQLRTTVPGEYEVAIWYSASSNRATDARFSVVHAGGTTPISVNQRTTGGQWRVLGNFVFLGDSSERVELRNNHATNGDYVIADAVRVRLLDELPVELDAWVIE